MGKISYQQEKTVITTKKTTGKLCSIFQNKLDRWFTWKYNLFKPLEPFFIQICFCAYVVIFVQCSNPTLFAKIVFIFKGTKTYIYGIHPKKFCPMGPQKGTLLEYIKRAKKVGISSMQYYDTLQNTAWQHRNTKHPLVAQQCFPYFWIW